MTKRTEHTPGPWAVRSTSAPPTHSGACETAWYFGPTENGRLGYWHPVSGPYPTQAEALAAARKAAGVEE